MRYAHPIPAPSSATPIQQGLFAMLGLSGVWMVLVLGTAGVKWIPIVSIGPLSIEAHNMFTLLTVAILGVHLVTRPVYRFPPVFLLVFALNLYLLLLLMVHHGTIWSGVILSFPTGLAAFALCNLSYRWLDNLKPVALLASGFFWFLMIYSANTAGINLIEDFIRYITTLERGYFIFQTLRPIFNAFTSANVVDPVYEGSNMNHMAAAVFIYVALCIAAIMQNPRNRVLIALLGFQMFFLFIVFSSTVMMMVFFAVGVMTYVAVRSRHNALLWLGGLSVLLAASAVFAQAIVEMIVLNVLSDGYSLSARGEQYSGAVGVIVQYPLFGDGRHSFGGHSVHNLLLFSWMSSGLIAAGLVLAIYALCIGMMLRGARALSSNTTRRDLALLLLLLPPVFIVRTNFAGGGGMPTGVENSALAIAVLAGYRLSEVEAQTPSPSARYA